ncbi:MAG: ATP-dependent Clp protease adaptor ClpS [Pirellulales bacterium]|nr:ATP-dependent Clp protease adaptor ClpS [Pirellulales bacterium]
MKITRNGLSAAQGESVGAAVAEPPVETEPTQPKRREATNDKKKPKRQPPYQVVLWDDDDHSHGYVMTMLLELFGHPLEKGYQLAKEVDTTGRAVVLTTTREHAELKRDQIHAYGKDGLIDGCQGSMWATIEPVE